MELIKLHLSNNKVSVYDIKDIQRLRIDYNISGVLSGTLPQVGQQNIFLSIPLILIQEEVVILIKNKLAVLCDNDHAHITPTQSQSINYHQQRLTSSQAQQLLTAQQDDNKRDKMAKLFQQDIINRRKEKELIKSTSSFQLNVPDTIIPTLPNIISPPITLRNPPTPTTVINKADPTRFSYQIIISPSSTPLPWFCPSTSNIYTTLESARAAGKWSYPNTALERSRCKVYEDLWRRGYFMGVGMRFGGDFLIYPGDSLRYHSHFTLTVLTTPTTSIMPLDLVAYGRLATAVKKAHLLASWDEETDKVEYLSLEWAAFG